MRIWTGPVREFSHRPYAAVSASCSAGVRSARLTVDTAAATAAPPSPRPITPSAVTARYRGSSGAGGPPCRRASCGLAQAGGAGMPPGAVTSRRGERACRHAAIRSRSRVSPSRCPITRAAAATATRRGQDGEHRRARTRRRVASNPAQMMTAAVARMATWRAVSPARILSGRSMSAGMGVLAGGS